MSPEEETLEKIKFALLCNNEAQAIRILEQFIFYYREQKDERAIDFAEWLRTNTKHRKGGSYKLYQDFQDYNISEILEIYKKQKGL